MNLHGQDNIVITGVGIVSALGRGVDAHRRALRQGMSGIRQIRCFDPSPYYCRTAGEWADLPSGDDRFTSDMGRGLKLLLIALEDLFDGRGIDRRRETGALILGNTLGGMEFATSYARAIHDPDHHEKNASTLRMFLASKEANIAASMTNIHGPVHVVSNACASSLNAIEIGARYLRSGECRYAVVGGYEPLCEFAHAGFCSLRALTPGLCRPFDAERDGMTLGEGAGLLLLEREEDAVNPLARFTGYGESIDTHHLTRCGPDGVGPERAMRKAMAQTGGADDLAFIVAHATATPANDDVEAAAIARVLGKRAEIVPVTALKPIFGHALGAAGAIDSIAALLALKDGFVPPLLNCRSPSVRTVLNLTKDRPRETHDSAAMINAFGFGGMNACAIFRKI